MKQAGLILDEIINAGIYTLYLVLCKVKNEILKEAKNAEKSHF